MDNEGYEYFSDSDSESWRSKDTTLEEGEIFEEENISGASVFDFAQENNQPCGSPVTGFIYPIVEFPSEQPDEQPYKEQYAPVYEQSCQADEQPKAWQQQSGLPDARRIEHMIAESQRSQIAAGELQLQMQMRQRQQQHQQHQQHQQRLTEEPAQESYADIDQQIRDSQQLQTEISESLARLEQARQGIAQHIQRLKKHLQDQRVRERHHRLRARKLKRLHRLHAQQIQHGLQRRGVDMGTQHQVQDQNQTSTHTSRAPPNPYFKPTIDYLARKLHALVSITTGQTHPYFPKSILGYNLLTSAQLDALAMHFHQTYPPTENSWRYPMPVKPWLVTNGLVNDMGVDISVKRRRFGQFIGLHGCESPTTPDDGRRDREGETPRQQIERDWELRREGWRAEEEERLKASRLAAPPPGTPTAMATGMGVGPSMGNVRFVHWDPNTKYYS
ncbi:hypothetical protein BDW69DRAFT_147626 [Aspergillus filifer]